MIGKYLYLIIEATQSSTSHYSDYKIEGALSLKNVGFRVTNGMINAGENGFYGNILLSSVGTHGVAMDESRDD